MKKFTFLFAILTALVTLNAVELTRPAAPDFKLNAVPEFPPVPSAAQLAALPKSGTPKNIILIIGDGMGQGALNFARCYVGGAIAADALPVKGLCTTRSANQTVTDSAAAGTAIATGYKTNNGMLALSPDRKPMRTIAEAAHDSGRRVALITDDSLTGATPSAFASHVPGRGDSAAIALAYSKCGFDILVGKANKTAFLPKNGVGGSRADNLNLLFEMERSGYTLTNTVNGFCNAESAAKTLSFIDFRVPGELGQVAAAAFARLDNPKGFFAMVECCWPDYGGHGNKPDLTLNGVASVQYVLTAALDFAKTHPDTLIVVTADHETGAITAVANPAAPKKPFIAYGTGSHTCSPVLVFAVGPGSEAFRGAIDNTGIAPAFAKLWNLQLGLK